MKKRIWDLYAPIYKRAMKADQRIYDFMYERIPTKIAGKEVLEIATGPGLLAKHVAPAAKRSSSAGKRETRRPPKDGSMRWASHA